MKTEQIQVLVNLLNFLFSNNLLPLTSSPLDCQHAPFQATFLPKDGVRCSIWGSWFIHVNSKLELSVSCIVSQHSSCKNKRAWALHATDLQNKEWKRSKSRSLSICLICCFPTPYFPWPLHLKTVSMSHFTLLVFILMKSDQANYELTSWT